MRKFTEIDKFTKAIVSQYRFITEKLSESEKALGEFYTETNIKAKGGYPNIIYKVTHNAYNAPHQFAQYQDNPPRSEDNVREFNTNKRTIEAVSELNEQLINEGLETELDGNKIKIIKSKNKQ